MNKIITLAILGIPAATAGFFLLLSFYLSKPPAAGNQSIASPDLFLWAWQRQEDLAFIPVNTGVALWIATLEITGGTIISHLRQNPVVLPGDTPLIAVIRLEAGTRSSLPDVNRLAEIIMTVFQPTDAQELQLDFDASVSQREYYRDLLSILKQHLGDRPLSITALASWCMGDPWINDLSIDYAVPMLYRMGHDAASIRHELTDGGHFSTTVCAHNVGYSLDEQRIQLKDVHRVFLFSDGPWNATSYAEIRHEIFRDSRK